MAEPAAVPETAPLVRFSDLLADADADARALHDAHAAGLPFGPITGLFRLDRALGGALAPGLHIVHGSPGAGKTAFALQVAASCECPALYVTCEMRPLVLLKRTAARVTETFLGRFGTGELAPAEAMALYRRAAHAAPRLALLDATQTPALPAGLLLGAEATRRLPGGSVPHLLIIVDSLHSWADGLGSVGDVAEYDRLNEALAHLRALSHRTGAAILVVAERNRQAMRGGGQSAGAGTRKIEYGAETVIELQADEDDKADERAVELKISKNRNGVAGKSIHLLFDGRLQRFREDAQ